jgi:electron transport complex protein RnfB
MEEWNIMLAAVIALAGLGFLGSLGLAIAARVLAVETDPRVEEIEEALPGANCGACGSPGCSELAKRIAEGKADVDACPVGGQAVAKNIARIMGVDFSGGGERKVAIVLCAGNNEIALKKYHYNGIYDCVSADMFFGGDKACSYGCLGLGTCVGACSFGAIDILPEGIARVNSDKCTGCGKCVEACPKGIIKLVPAERKVHILCSSHDKGAVAKKNCGVACIGCQKCVKAAPEGAIQMDDFLAVINYDMVIPESVAAECPMGTIKVYDSESKVNQAVGGGS